VSDAQDRERARHPPAPPDAEALRLRAIADAVPALIAYVDADQRYRFNNQAYAEWFGRTPSELLGQRVADVLGAVAFNAVHDGIEAALSGQRTSYERLVPYERGSRWTSTEFTPDIGDDGRVRGFVALVTDITEHKRAEDHVRAIQEQLLLADHLASVGTLAMGVAHEINNPLAIVLGNQDWVIAALTKLASECTADQLTKTPDALERSRGIAARLAEMRQSLQDARQAADRVRRIVRDLEVFSGSGAAVRQPVDVHCVLASALEMVGDEILCRGRLVRDYAPVPLVGGNDALLRQVFVNLLANAAQAIRQGDAETNEIRLSTRADDAGLVIIEVSDTGCGIPHEHLGRVFDPFFTTHAPGMGPGLGLWVSSRIVAAIGGTMTAESEVGRGSTFRVALPASS
jgi:PAS domain S-box-containing protein